MLLMVYHAKYFLYLFVNDYKLIFISNISCNYIYAFNAITTYFIFNLILTKIVKNTEYHYYLK